MPGGPSAPFLWVFELICWGCRGGMRSVALLDELSLSLIAHYVQDGGRSPPRTSEPICPLRGHIRDSFGGGGTPPGCPELGGH
jgi:hypothetical protein